MARKNTGEPLLGDDASAVKALKAASVSELREWVIQNRCLNTFDKIQNELKQMTFRDEDGVLRYIQSWIPASDDGIPASMKYYKYVFDTGCYEISLSLPDEQSIVEGRIEPQENSLTLRILRDWERLWRFLDTDESDDLAKHGALLRASIGFFLHEKTHVAFCALLVYNFTLNLWFYSVSPLFSAESSFFTSLFYILGGFLYISFRRLYVSSSSAIPSIVPDKHPFQNHFNDGENIVRRGAPKNLYKMHLRGAIRHYALTTWDEMKSIFSLFCGCKSTTDKASNGHAAKRHLSRENVSSFDNLLNIALKYILHHCERDAREITLNRAGYRLTFLMISVLLPGYCAALFAYYWWSAVTTCNYLGQGSDGCRNYIIYLALSFGSFTMVAFYGILYGTMVNSIIGLCYGTDLAYCMVDCWMKRYSGLRKIVVPTLLVSKEHSGNASTLEMKEGTIMEENIYGSLKEDAAPLRRMELSDLSDALKTNATEQYLFVVEYMRQAGAVWSAAIVGMYLYSVFLVVVTIIFCVFVASGQNFSFVVSLVVPTVLEILLFSIFPTWSLAHANSLNYPLLDLFTNCSEDDFKIIGKITVIIYC